MIILSGSHPVELAIGWPSGLKILLDVGFNSERALEISLGMDDWPSTKIILASENCLREGYSFTAVLLYFTQEKPKIIQAIVQAFAKRRQALLELAIKEFPEEAVVRLGLLNEKTLDVAMSETYQELRNRSVHIPRY